MLFKPSEQRLLRDLKTLLVSCLLESRCSKNDHTHEINNYFCSLFNFFSLYITSTTDALL